MADVNDNPSLGLDDEVLGEVARRLGNKFFRAGLLLGIWPHEMDIIQWEFPSQWQMNMQLLKKWRENTSPESERLQLAQVLKRLGLDRFASTLDTRVSENPGLPTFIDPRREGFTLQELDEISLEVGEEWEQLGICLHVSNHIIQEIRHRNEEICLHAFRCLWAWYERGEPQAWYEGGEPQAWYEGGENVSRKTLADALRKICKGRLAAKIHC